MALQRKYGARLLASVAAVAMIATGCASDGDSSGDDTETEAPDDGGTETETEGDQQASGEASCGTTELVWAHEQEPPNMHLDDPTNNLSITSWIRQSMWEGLYGQTADTAFFPELLAQEMEITDNGDGTFTYTGQLRDGLTWSDGTELTSEHVIGTLDIILEGYDREAGTGGVYSIVSRVGYDQIIEYSASSPTEFSFTTEGFFSGHEALLTEIFPTHIVTDAAMANEVFPEFQVDGEPLPSSGPMLWGSFTPGENLVLETNQDYHGSVSPDVTNDGVACVSGVRINFVTDTDAQINALQAGDADLIFTQPQLQFEDALVDSDEFTVASLAGPVYEHWSLNMNDEHLSDPLVREALAYAMNKAEVMEGLYTPLFGDVLPAEGLGNVFWLSNQEPYVDNAGNAGYGMGDVDSARANLEEAGYTEGDDGVYEHPERGRLSLSVGTTGGNELRELQQQILQGQFGAAGIEITIDNVEGGAYFSEVPFNPQSLACGGGTPDGETWDAGTPDDTSDDVTSDCDIWDITQFAYVGSPWPGGSTGNFTSGYQQPFGHNSEAFDELANECNSTVDEQERADCYNELDRMVTTLEGDPELGLFMMPITQKPSFYAYSNTRLVQGAVSPDGQYAGPLVNVVDYQPAG